MVQRVKSRGPLVRNQVPHMGSPVRDLWPYKYTRSKFTAKWAMGEGHSFIYYFSFQPFQRNKYNIINIRHFLENSKQHLPRNSSNSV